MNRDTAAEGHVAGDRLGTQRRAAAGEGGWQVPYALDLDRGAAPVALRARRAHGRPGLLGRDEPLGGLQQLGDGDLALPELLIEMIGVARLQLAYEGGELFGARSYPTELAFRDGAAGAAVVGDVLLAKPGSDLGAIARGDQIALLRRQPVPTRGFLLPGDDLHDLAVGEGVGEGHDPAVDLGPAAAVSQ